MGIIRYKVYKNKTFMLMNDSSLSAFKKKKKTHKGAHYLNIQGSGYLFDMDVTDTLLIAQLYNS